MTEEKKRISAGDLVADIRAGATDEFLLIKHDISERSLGHLLKQLVAEDRITEEELNQRGPLEREGQKDKIEKYKQLFSMSEAAVKDEDSRYDRLEDTAHKYIPVYVVSQNGDFEVKN